MPEFSVFGGGGGAVAGDLREIRKPGVLPPGVPAGVASIDWTQKDPRGDLNSLITNRPGHTTINSITTNGTTWTVVLASAPLDGVALAAGDTCLLSVTPMNYSGLFTIASVVNSTTFTIANTTQPAAFTSGVMVARIVLGNYIYRMPLATGGKGKANPIQQGKSFHLKPPAGGACSIRGSEWWGDAYWVQPYSSTVNECWRSTVSTNNAGVSIFIADTGANGSARAIYGVDQVFYNNRPLKRVVGSAMPSSGEYTVDSLGYIILHDDPQGQLVEVTTSVPSSSPNGTMFSDNGTASIAIALDHLDIRHSSSRLNGAGSAAWWLGSYMNGGTVDNGAPKVVDTCTFMYHHGVPLAIFASPWCVVRNSEFGYNGQGLTWDQGAWTAPSNNQLTIASLPPSYVTGNKFHHNSGNGYSGFSGGAAKFAQTNNLQLTHNDSWSNAGPGLWLDIYNTEVYCAFNRVHHNTFCGIMKEISGDRITGAIGNQTVSWRGQPSVYEKNILTENGWLDCQIGNSAGAGAFFFSTSENYICRDNLIAWNYMPVNCYWDMNRGMGTVSQGCPTGGVVIAGTVATTSGTNIVTGTGTTFNGPIVAGMLIGIDVGGSAQYFLVQTVDSATQLHTTTNATATVTGKAIRYSPGPATVQVYRNYILGEGNFQNNTLNAHAFLLNFCSSGSGTGWILANAADVGAWQNHYWARCYGNANSLDGNTAETTWFTNAGATMNTIAGLNATHAGQGYDGAHTASDWISTTNTLPPPQAVQDVCTGVSALLLQTGADFQAFVATAYAAGLIATAPEGGHGQSAGSATSLNGIEGPVAQLVPITASYNIQDWDRRLVVDATSGSFTLTLPRATRYGVLNRDELVLKRKDNTANTVTVAARTGPVELVDNAASTTLLPLSAAGAGVLRLFPDGSNWYIAQRS